MGNPYLIEGPALISFSGGRTSAYMLKMILDAHGGTLPDDVHVCFANTGKEREETLRFVHECATRWGVRVRWLEWRAPKESEHKGLRFAEVGYNSASRSGEPFKALIRSKQYLPNSQMRYCTIELKIRVMRDYMKSLGLKTWTNATGLRADEMHRVWKTYERNDSGKERFRTACPMAKAGNTKPDVLNYWFGEFYTGGTPNWPVLLSIPVRLLPQRFDLALADEEGNCDLCFLKGRGKRAAIIRRRPDLAQWWAEAEAEAKCSVPAGARFDANESVEMLVAAVRSQPMMDFYEGSDPDEEHDAECGTWCAAS
jgi:3'-phosphoadenosine 5'-phosphosulfate sulfotransferase (PAPS reductase)/FAD synthetase